MSNPAASEPAAVLLAGPTCAGKTALALELAEHWRVEIVSVDSAQVYRGMDIGTSKPSAAIRARVPHHLVDICDPTERYSAGRFRRDALELIAAIRARGRVPLLVGGTMLYFRALLRGIAPLPEANPALRARLEQRARQCGWPALHAELASRDPEAAARIRPADGQRIQRALEVLELTGERLSVLQRRTEPVPFPVAAFALMPRDRAQLYARIDQRFTAMMSEGLLDEVRTLRARDDLDPDLPSLRSVGYRQLWSHLEGACGLPEAVAAGQRATRNLAKRQLTWLRSEPVWSGIHGLEEQELAPILRVMQRVACR
ncbi:MAG: tRNA (adenosine(37)-N6)-dimethylallyltransferase MiaA [Steroidobacteraceae bacterium]|nr:tRNA (adenosine(37)-N6)-dimethylallyltransferase MiaA [Steroidobacteraceae bacterium]